MRDGLPPNVSIRGLATALLGLAVTAAPVRAQAQAAPSSDEQRAKLISYFSDNFPLVEKILDLYRVRFAEATPIFEAADVELPASLGGKPKPDDKTPPPPVQPQPAQPQPTPTARHSPFLEAHIEPSGSLNGAHLDNHTPLPDVVPTSSVKEYLARRAAYEKANIEAYYFYKALHERQRTGNQ